MAIVGVDCLIWPILFCFDRMTNILTLVSGGSTGFMEVTPLEIGGRESGEEGGGGGGGGGGGEGGGRGDPHQNNYGEHNF